MTSLSYTERKLFGIKVRKIVRSEQSYPNPMRVAIIDGKTWVLLMRKKRRWSSPDAETTYEVMTNCNRLFDQYPMNGSDRIAICKAFIHLRPPGVNPSDCKAEIQRCHDIAEAIKTGEQASSFLHYAKDMKVKVPATVSRRIRSLVRAGQKAQDDRYTLPSG